MTESRIPAKVFFTVLIVFLVDCAGPSAGPALSASAESLRSLASEGALLARDAAAGRSTQVFVREHVGDLVTLASQLETSLGTVEGDAWIGAQLERLRAVASRVATDLRLLGSGGDPDELSTDLQAAAHESRGIGDSIS